MKTIQLILILTFFGILLSFSLLMFLKVRLAETKANKYYGLFILFGCIAYIPTLLIHFIIPGFPGLKETLVIIKNIVSYSSCVLGPYFNLIASIHYVKIFSVEMERVFKIFAFLLAFFLQDFFPIIGFLYPLIATIVFFLSYLHEKSKYFKNQKLLLLILNIPITAIGYNSFMPAVFLTREQRVGYDCWIQDLPFVFAFIIVFIILIIKYGIFGYKLNLQQLNNTYEDKLNTIIINAGLTEAEKEILLLKLKGYSNSQIAELRNIEVSTVKTHINNMNKKLNIKDFNTLINRIA